MHKLAHDLTEFMLIVEGCELKPYLCSAGYPTIGVGSRYYKNGKEVTLKDKAITKDKAMELLAYHLHEYRMSIIHLININCTLKDYQVDALTSLVYNIGLNAFACSTLLKLLNNNQIERASSEFDRWVYADGMKERGLINRRRVDKRLFVIGYPVEIDY